MSANVTAQERCPRCGTGSLVREWDDADLRRLIASCLSCGYYAEVEVSKPVIDTTPRPTTNGSAKAPPVEKTPIVRDVRLTDTTLVAYATSAQAFLDISAELRELETRLGTLRSQKQTALVRMDAALKALNEQLMAVGSSPMRASKAARAKSYTQSLTPERLALLARMREAKAAKAAERKTTAAAL